MSENTVPCVTCGKPMDGRYCSHCGERRVGPDDHSLHRFFVHGIEAFTNADGKIFATLSFLITRPGRLTADYLKGRRKPYIQPLQLFLIANLVFFLLHPMIGSNTITTDLNTQMRYTWHSGIVRAMVTPRLAARAVSANRYAETFDPAAVRQAKSLVILVVPIFSLAVAALYWRQRPHYSAHLVFSLHFCAFWLLLVCGILALTNLTVGLLRYVHVFPSAVVVSRSIVAVTLAIMTTYLFCSVRMTFGRQSVWISAVKALALGIALDLSLQAYRFVLFFITFWST